MKKSLVVVALLALSSFCFGNSIILPFWQDSATGPVYTMFIVFNTSTSTSNLVQVMYYGKTGNPQQGSPIVRTISAKNVEIFGTNHYGGELKVATGDPLGYALVTESAGKLLAIGIVYDNDAKAGYVIPCFPGGTDGSATTGW
jgi:hypothetical protein